MTTPATTRPGNPIGRVEEKLDRLERRLAFLDQLPAVLEIGASTADDLAQTHQLHERIERALHLVEKLTRPETLSRLELLLELASTAPDHLSTVMSTVDDVASEATRRGIDVSRLVPDLAHLATSAASALQHARDDAEQPGIFGALAALRDPDVSRAVGFAIAMARTFGKDLRAQQSLSAGESR